MMRRALTLAAAALLGLLLLAGAGLFLLQRALADGSLAPRIDAALEAALGRAVTLGPITLRPGLRPRIVVADVAIANLPGGARPDFARIRRLELRLALLPLLSGRVEIEHLGITGADVLLERDAAGRPNWVLGAATPGDAPPAAHGSGMRLAIRALDIADSRIAVARARPGVILIRDLALRQESPGGATRFDGAFEVEGQPVTLSGKVGAWAGAAPPPLAATVEAPGITLRLAGQAPRSLDETGWAIDLEARAASLATLGAWLAPGRALPMQGPLLARARLGPGADGIALSDLSLAAGPLPAGALPAGLAVAEARVTAAGLDAPLAVAARGSRGGVPLALAGTLPPLARLLVAEPDEALPVAATLSAGDARLTLGGTVTRAGLPHGLALDARLNAPDLAALGPLVGAALPPLRDVAIGARAGWRFPSMLRLDDLRAGADLLDSATGALEIAWAPRLEIGGRIASRRLDLDALAGDSGPRAARGQHLIPDASLPVAALRAFDATLDLSVAALQAGGIAWRDISTRIVLAGGRLALQPFAAGIPGGRIEGRLALDATAAPPALSLSLRSTGTGIDLPAFMRAFGRDDVVLQGPAEIALDLAGRGTTLGAVAATLSGEAGLAMVEGRLSGANMLRVGPDLARALIPRDMPGEESNIRCAALRLSAEGGVAQSQALLIEGGFGRIEGSLALNLRDETLAARLLPEISVLGGVSLRTPVGIGGSWAAPRVDVEPAAALAQVIGDTVANRLWRSATAEWLRGTTGGAAPEAECDQALRLARLGRAGRAPAPAQAVVPLVPRELQGAARGAVGAVDGVARGAAGAVEGAARGAQDVLRGIGGVLGGAGGLLGGGR